MCRCLSIKEKEGVNADIKSILGITNFEQHWPRSKKYIFNRDIYIYVHIFILIKILSQYIIYISDTAVWTWLLHL